MESYWYYVCEHCGSIVTITDSPIPEGETWECSDCTGRALREFTSEDATRDYARRISARRFDRLS